MDDRPRARCPFGRERLGTPTRRTAFGRLLPQLSRSAKPLDHQALAWIVACPVNTVLLARSQDEIVGTLTLVMFPIPSGLRARIEDVVVDAAARGQGVRAALTREALRLVRRS
jgi:GNAT superfamily N-acetyltransferase